MKKIVVTIGLVISLLSMNMNTASSVEMITLPSQAALKLIFKRNFLTYFDEKMKFSKEFADQQIMPATFVMKLALALHDYEEEYKIDLLKKQKGEIIHVLVSEILADYPEVIKDLEKEGVFSIPEKKDDSLHDDYLKYMRDQRVYSPVYEPSWEGAFDCVVTTTD